MRVICAFVFLFLVTSCGTVGTVKVVDSTRIQQVEKDVATNRQILIVILKNLTQIHKTLQRMYQPEI